MMAPGICMHLGWTDSPLGPNRRPVQIWVLIVILVISGVWSRLVLFKSPSWSATP